MTAEKHESAGVLATVNEAAFVAGVSRHAVNQAIDRREIRSRRMRRKVNRSGRAIGGPELIYLRVHSHLSPRTRKAVYQQLSGESMETIPRSIALEGGGKLDLADVVDQVLDRLSELDRLKSRVEENPNIRGGEPVFRGTRIPVHMIADFLGQGVPREELLEDYPALTDESLDVAGRYAELYPRRGRPRQAPWRIQMPTHVFRADDLSDER
jgi:uncharacterized protein (DUF433 family)